ncbi:hypothetical protein BBV17_28960 [Cytobacillus oceanisediminis]|uniref:Uncharacterized protein n=1 Tax=Cytobacillus oceanisediminis TaxID=665099 RepID=A0ABX3CKL8_9BACI|nr:hypothetical protein BBV17_28960 [Cytobacillus oceanisediminis]
MRPNQLKTKLPQISMQVGSRVIHEDTKMYLLDERRGALPVIVNYINMVVTLFYHYKKSNNGDSNLQMILSFL